MGAESKRENQKLGMSDGKDPTTGNKKLFFSVGIGSGDAVLKSGAWGTLP